MKGWRGCCEMEMELHVGLESGSRVPEEFWIELAGCLGEKAEKFEVGGS